MKSIIENLKQISKQYKIDAEQVDSLDLSCELDGNAEDLDTVIKFIDDVFDLACGDDSLKRKYTKEEVLQSIRDFSDKALYTEQLIEEDEDHKREYYAFLERGY